MNYLQPQSQLSQVIPTLLFSFPSIVFRKAGISGIAGTQVEQDSYGCRLGLGSETEPHEGCRQTPKSSRDNQTSSLYGRELMTEEKRLFSVGDAAKYLGVQKTIIYSWAWRRKIPSVKMGRRLLFDREDLDQMIETGKRRER